MKTLVPGLKEEIKEEVCLAVLLIIIDDLPHEAIWRLWEEHYYGTNGDAYMSTAAQPIEAATTIVTTAMSSQTITSTTQANTSTTYQQKCSANATPVRFLIHAKYPEKIKSKWVKERLVTFHLMPSWGSLMLTEVMIKMLNEVD